VFATSAQNGSSSFIINQTINQQTTKTLGIPEKKVLKNKDDAKNNTINAKKSMINTCLLKIYGNFNPKITLNYPKITRLLP